MANEMFRLMEDLFPLNRSITGEGVRDTLTRIEKEIPINKFAILSGERVFDWSVPDEWNVTSAKIYRSDGSTLMF